MSRWGWTWLLLVAGAAHGVELPEWARSEDVTVAKAAFPEGETIQVLDCQELEVGASGSREFRIRRIFYVREGKADTHDHVGFVTSSNRKLHEIRAWRRDANGRVEVFDRPIFSQRLGGKLYSEDRENIVPIPGIGPGAVIAIELAFHDDSPDFRTDYTPARSDVPVLRWEYRLKLPDGWSAQGAWFDPTTDTLVTAEPAGVAGGWILWTRERIPTFGKKEPYAPRETAISPQFLVRYGRPGDPSMGTWKSVAEWFSVYSASALKESESLRPAGEKIFGGARDFDARVSLIADWVRSSIGYVQIHLEDGGFRPHPAPEVYANRFGDCKDMAHLAIALLDLAGIRSHPVLTETGDRSHIRPGFPTPSFNHCIVAIERPGDDAGLLYFDPTARSIPLGRLSQFLEGAPALVVGSPFDSALTRLPESSASQNGLRVRGVIAIAPGLRAIASIEELRLGQQAYAARDLLLDMSPQDRSRWVQDRVARRYVGAHVDSVAFPDLSRVSDTLTIRYAARIPEIGRMVGDLALIQPDFITAWDARFFASDERLRPIQFSYPYRNETRLEVHYPEEWTAREVPAEAAAESPFAYYRRRYEGETGVVRVERIEEVRLKNLPAKDYRLAKEWDRTATEADRQRLVLSRP